jgi:hypothetical protein
MRKYPLPLFLEGICDQAKYFRWLKRAASRHLKRDRYRGNTVSTAESYRLAIHNAVHDHGELDFYTGEKLNWSLICTYNNDESKAKRRKYKELFALMPSVDHVGDGTGAADFKICAWRTNDAKNDLAYSDFVELCRLVLQISAERN